MFFVLSVLLGVPANVPGGAGRLGRTLTCGSSRRYKNMGYPGWGIPYFGAGDRTRTGTLSPAVDFESTTSTISSHRHLPGLVYTNFFKIASTFCVNSCKANIPNGCPYIRYTIDHASFRVERSGIEESTHWRCCLTAFLCEDPSTSAAPALRMTQKGDGRKMLLFQQIGGIISP